MAAGTRRLKSIGRRIELVAMDTHCQDITLGLYEQTADDGTRFLVHSYSSREGAVERTRFVARAMAVMGGMEIDRDHDTMLRFPCGRPHRVACKRIFLESAKFATGASLKARPLEIFDKRKRKTIHVTSLGEGEYLTRTAGEVGLQDRRAAQGWSLWQARETEEPAEQLVAWQEPASPLLEACHSAMRESWPVPPGWALERTGCVTSSMADSGQSSPGGPGEGLAYRIYELSAEHDSRLARAAARELLKEWEGESEVGDTRVTLRRRFDAPLQLSDGRRGSAMRTLRNAVEAEFLGLAEAVTLHGQFLTIRSAASALTLFRRLSDLDRRLPISIRRLTRTQSGMEIELMPKVEIMLPPSG